MYLHSTVEAFHLRTFSLNPRTNGFRYILQMSEGQIGKQEEFHIKKMDEIDKILFSVILTNAVNMFERI